MSERLKMERVSMVCHEGSWGATKRQPRTMKISAWICDEKRRGGFEVYDLESKGEDYYGEGGLWLDSSGHLCDYDGVGGLDWDIVRWLDDLGHINPDPTDYFRKGLNKRDGDES